MPDRDGFFIEAGANDRYSQSNTYYFERMKGWSGVLVEGIPELYERCKRERPDSHVFNCALVSPESHRASVTMHYADLMSIVDKAGIHKDKNESNTSVGIEREYTVEVPGRTLTSILDQVNLPLIDLLSLDVEGYESEVLKKLNFTRYKPKYILVEINYPKKVYEELRVHYNKVDRFSEKDVLYRVKK